MCRIEKVVLDDPSVAAVASKADPDTTQLVIDLKERHQRPPLDEVLGQLPSAAAACRACRFTQPGADPADRRLGIWAGRLVDVPRHSEVLVGVNSDSRKNGLEAQLLIDRGKAAQLRRAVDGDVPGLGGSNAPV